MSEQGSRLDVLRPWARALLGRALHGRVRAMVRERVSGRYGLEIGGWSAVFSKWRALPVYPFAARIDNCNFAEDTLWRRNVPGPKFVFRPDAEPGMQFIADATDLSFIGDAAYDFILSSHTIEHLANPLKALREWKRVLRPGGMLILVAPHRDGTFDHRRPVTPLAHLIDDDRRDTQEDDSTHFDEILALHDRSRERVTSSAEDLERHVRTNPSTRSLHHHVFDTAAIAAVADHAGFQIVALAAIRPHDIFLVGDKLLQSPDNARFLDRRAKVYRSSPFRSDRFPA